MGSRKPMMGGVTVIHNDPAAMKNLSPRFTVGILFVIVSQTHLIAFSMICWLCPGFCHSTHLVRIPTATDLNPHNYPRCETLQMEMQI